MEKLKFEITKITNIEKFNPLFDKCKIYICYSDLNRNNSDISKTVIESAIPTLYGCPIVGEFKESKNDFTDHGGEIQIDGNGEYEFIYTTMPYGFIPESSEVSWEFEDGKDYLTCTGLLWTSRYPEVLVAIEEGRPQSMEIANIEGGFNDENVFVVSSFVFSALCILGKDVEPCFEGAKIVAYTLDKDEFKSEFNLMIQELKDSLQGGDNLRTFSNDKKKIEIDNSKDAANMSGSWGSVDKTKLRNDLVDASNAQSLVNEAYLIVDEGWKDKPSESLHYPHHVIKDGKLVVHKAGIEAAFQRAVQTGDIKNSKVKSHIRKHYKELGLDMTELDKYGLQQGGQKVKKSEIIAQNFSLSQEQLEDGIRRELAEIASVELWDDFSIPRFSLEDYYVPENIFVAYDYEDCRLVIGNFEVLGDNVEIDKESFKPAKVNYEPMDITEADDPDNDGDGKVVIGEFAKSIAGQAKKAIESQKETFSKQVEEKENALLALNEQFTQVKTESEEKDKQIESLQQFKHQVEESQRKEKVDELFTKFAKHLSKEEIESFREKEATFSTFEDFEKEIKSFVCDKVVEDIKKDPSTATYSRMGIPPQNNDTNTEPSNVWDRLSNKNK